MKLPKISTPKPDFSDLLIMAGGISLAKGLYMIYPPVMFIVIGLALIWIGLPGKAK